MSTLIALALAFQMVSMPSPVDQRAYVLDHPINPAWLILATQDGRFTIARPAPCDWLRGDISVELAAGDGSLRTLAPADGQGGACPISVVGLVDPTPCFANADGECDLEAGEHNW